MQDVVVALDPFDPAPSALAWAVDDARRLGRELRVLSVLDEHVGRLPGGEPVVPAHELHALVAESQQEALEKLDVDGVVVTTASVTGHPADVLVGASREAHRLVLGTRGMGQVRAAMAGAVGHHVATAAGCPVVVVPEGAAPCTRVVAGVDGSPGGDDALRVALAEAGARGVAVEAVAAVDLPPPLLELLVLPDPGRAPRSTAARQAAAHALAGAIERSGAHAGEVVRHVEVGQPAEVLRERGRAAGMVVVGRRGFGGFAGLLLGSTGHRLLREPASTLVVVPPEWEQG